MKIHEDNLVLKEIRRLKLYLEVDRHFEENILDNNIYVNQFFSSLEKQISISFHADFLANHFDDSPSSVLLLISLAYCLEITQQTNKKSRFKPAIHSNSA